MKREILHIIIAVLLTAVSCVRDDGGGSLKGDSAHIRLTIRSTGTPSSQSRAVDDIEYRIDNVCALVLEETDVDGEYLYQYMVEGENLGQGTDMSAYFDLNVAISNQHLKFIILANYPPGLRGQLPAAGTPEEDLRNDVVAFYSGTVSSIPMYGEVEIPALSSTQVNRIEVSMMRAMAKVIVDNELAGDSWPFELREVHIVRANDRLQVIPDMFAFSETVQEPTITRPSVPDAARHLANPVSVTAVNGVVPPIYIPGSRLAQTPDEEKNATCVIVGGVFGTDLDVSYYRIDFDSHTNNNPFGQILRNHIYHFNITKVLDRGMASINEAASQEAKSMLAIVSAWTSTAQAIIMPQTGNMVSFSTLKVALPWSAGSTGSVRIESTVPFTWSLAGDATVANSADGATQSNNFFNCVIHTNPANNYTLGNGKTVRVYDLDVTTKSDNTGLTQLLSTIDIVAGTGTLDINIAQDALSGHANDMVNILSFRSSNGTDEGSLGISTVPGSLSGPLRSILDNKANFGPSGKVAIGGFNYSELPATTLTNRVSPELFQQLMRADVVVLPDTNVSTLNAMFLVDWLKQSGNNHVLLIAHDSSAANANVESALSETTGYTLTWNNNSGLVDALSNDLGNPQGANSFGAYVSEPAAGGNDPFKAGPFGSINGSVSGNLVINSGNEVSVSFPANDQGMYLAPGQTQVQTLVNYSLINRAADGSVTKYPSNMGALCVDTNNRIIFYGQALLMNAPSTVAGGNASAAPMNTLWANTWSWVVEQVFRGR